MRNRRVAKPQTDSPREGGWGVVVVIATHLSLAIQAGLMRSFGILYLSWKEDFETNDKQTAAVQSIISSMSCFSVLPAGVLIQRYGCRITGMVGGGLSSTGLLFSYWVTDIFQFYIACFLTGVGTGLCYNSAVVVVALYFKRRYKIAHAVAYSGFGTGITAVPPVVQHLLEHYGWRGAILIASAISANCVVFGVVFRPNRDLQKFHGKSGSNINRQLAVNDGLNNSSDYQNCDESSCRDDAGLELEFTREASEGSHANQTGFVQVTRDPKNPNSIAKLLQRVLVALGFHLFLKSYRLALQSAIQLQYCMAYVVCLLYLVPRAQSVGVAPSSAAILISIFGIGSLLGRLGSGWLVSWKISAEHVTAISMILAGVSLLLLSFERYYVLAIASFLNGFASGVFFAVGVVLSRNFIGVRNLPIGMGISQFLIGIGFVTGPILAGWVLDVTDESYPTVFYVYSALCFLCAVQMILLPLLRRVEPGIGISPADV